MTSPHQATVAVASRNGRPGLAATLAAAAALAALFTGPCQALTGSLGDAESSVSAAPQAIRAASRSTRDRSTP